MKLKKVTEGKTEIDYLLIEGTLDLNSQYFKNSKKNIEEKKRDIELQIEKDFTKTQKDIIDLKKNSLATIQNISENIASNIIENISGDKLNESSIKATVEDITKKSIGKYL